MENNSGDIKKPIAHLTDGVYTKKEATEALKLLRDRKNDPAINIQMSENWEQINEVPDQNIFEYTREFEQAQILLKRINKPKFFKKYLKYTVVAASIAILISFGIIGYKYLVIEINSSIRLAEVVTGYGETRQVTLPDGTFAIMNACTRLTYPEKFNENERQVSLEGEAYFQVTRNEEQPFIISTGNFNVRVLGTAFNVQAYREDEIQSVNVESGKVQIDMPDAMSRLTANEQILINTKTSNYAKQTVDNEGIAVWRSGLLHFNKAPVTDVINQLERIYNYKIVFEGGQHFNNLISGEHENESLEEVLESIRDVTGIKWKTGKNKNEIILYK